LELFELERELAVLLILEEAMDALLVVAVLDILELETELIGVPS
jgi:hypothetical protein